MTRRLAIVAAALTAALTITAPASASLLPDSDTNGCIVVKPAQVAVCLNRF